MKIRLNAKSPSESCRQCGELFLFDQFSISSSSTYSGAQLVTSRRYYCTSNSPLPAVERRWLESIDPNHQAGIGHDIYLKLWALSEPNIPADYVLFDEAQDADPLMLGILLRQKYSGYLCRRCPPANLRVAWCSKCHATTAFARVSSNDLFSFWRQLPMSPMRC